MVVSPEKESPLIACHLRGGRNDGERGAQELVDWDEDALRAHAQAFSEDRFLSRIRAEVRDLQGA